MVEALVIDGPAAGDTVWLEPTKLETGLRTMLESTEYELRVVIQQQGSHMRQVFFLTSEDGDPEPAVLNKLLTETAWESK